VRPCLESIIKTDTRRRISESFEDATENRSPMSAAEKLPGQARESIETAQAAPVRPVRVLVSELLSGGREAILEHDGKDYRLRITANGKLILTK
jgi:hemin uptake protein HemP